VVWLCHCRLDASDRPSDPPTEDRYIDLKQRWNDKLTGDKPNIEGKGGNPFHNPNLAIKNPGLPGDWTRGLSFYLSITQAPYLCRSTTFITLPDRVSCIDRPWHNPNPFTRIDRSCICVCACVPSIAMEGTLLTIMIYSSFGKCPVRIQAATPRILTEAFLNLSRTLHANFAIILKKNTKILIF